VRPIVVDDCLRSNRWTSVFISEINSSVTA